MISFITGLLHSLIITQKPLADDKNSTINDLFVHIDSIFRHSLKLVKMKEYMYVFLKG